MAGPAGSESVRFDEPTRTPLYCHNCTHDFIAMIDYRVDGAQVIECPWCRHEHCRVVNGGVATEERWSGRDQRAGIRVGPEKVWKSNGAPIQTSSASHFLRQRWLERD